MDNKYEGSDHIKNGFFTPREIWVQVFGQDGRGGAIGELHTKVDESFNGLEKMVCEEFDTLGKKLDEYNGLRERIYEISDATDDIEKKQEDQIEVCKKQREELEKKEFKASTTNETFEKGKTEAFREVKQFVAIVAVAFTALAALVAMLGLFVF